MASDGERQRPFAAAYLILLDDGDVLLSQRRNTGHRDGEYSLVAGHVEAGESATEAVVREAKEEAGIDVDRSALDPVHVIHRNADDRVYLDVYFVASEWDGAVTNRAPGKCADLSWFDRTRLPDNTVPYVRRR